MVGSNKLRAFTQETAVMSSVKAKVSGGLFQFTKVVILHHIHNTTEVVYLI